VTIIAREATAPVEAAGADRAWWRAVRRHFWFGLALTAGLVLRLLAETAYRPALLYIDSVKYLEGSVATAPQGYQALLRLLEPVGGLALAAAVQHVFGLAMAVALYALLLRRGAPRWAATLAAAPVLLDAYQLQLEQTIMPDVLFETMITAGLVVLLWRGQRGPRVPGGAWPIAAGALVLGAAVTVREIGTVLIVPLVVFAVLTVPGWRRRMKRAGLAAGCFMLPVLGYLAGTFLVTGHFGMAGNGPSPQYGRAAAAADCATLQVPAAERALCPSPAQTLALGGVDGLLHNPRSPGHTAPVPPGLTRDEFLDRFALAVFRQQPLRVAASVARDSVRLFAPVRSGDPQVTPIARWQFQDVYPTYPQRLLDGLLHPAGARPWQRRRPGRGPARRLCPAGLPAGRGLHPRAAVRGLRHRGGGGRAATAHRPAHGPARAVPAGDAGRGGAAGELGRVRVQLAVPAARRRAAAAGGDARGHRPHRGQTVPLRGTFRLIRYAFTIVSTQALPSP